MGEGLGLSGYWLESRETFCHALFRRQCQRSEQVLLLAINSLQDLKSTSLLAFFFLITPKAGEPSFPSEQNTGIFSGEARDYYFLLFHPFPGAQTICDFLERHMHIKCSRALLVQASRESLLGAKELFLSSL